MRRPLTLAALAALALGCGGGTERPDADPAFAAAMPDYAGLSLDLTGDDGTTGEATLESALAPDATQLLPIAQEIVRPVNKVLAFIFRKVDLMAADKAAEVQPNVATWTKDIDGLTWEVFVQRDPPGGNSFFITVGALPKGGQTTQTSSDVVKLAKIDIVPDPKHPHRGQGHVDLDLAKLVGLFPESPVTGRLELTFNHEGGDKRITAKLTNFKTKSLKEPIASAVYTLNRLAGGAGAVRLSGLANANDPDDATATQPEWMLLEGRWVSGFDARFDAVAFDGDLNANAWVRTVECFDSTGKAGYARTVLRDPSNADADKRTVVLREAGKLEGCAERLRTDPDPSHLPDDRDAAKDVAKAEDAQLTPPADPTPQP